MKKIILLLASLFFFVISTIAQVGINTQNAIEIFNIDALGNNPKTNPQNSTNLDDDIILRNNKNNEANLVIGGKSLTEKGEISLELNAINKALLLNNVALTTIYDTTTIKNTQSGMLVYNTTTNATTMERLAPGLYLNYNLQWLRIPNIQEIVESSIANVMELAYATNSGLLTNTETGAGASILRIRTAGTTENETSIKINETGKYIFMFRLYGGPNSTEVNYRYNEYYLYIYNKTTSQVVGKTMMVALDNDKFNTYSATLYTPDLNENDEIDIRIGHVSGSRTWSLVSNPSTNANRTSFVFWKIQ